MLTEAQVHICWYLLPNISYRLAYPATSKSTEMPQSVLSVKPKVDQETQRNPRGNLMNEADVDGIIKVVKKMSMTLCQCLWCYEGSVSDVIWTDVWNVVVECSEKQTEKIETRHTL